MSSAGFESRKEIFGCLVKYLKEKNVSDDVFSVAESLDIEIANCSDIVDETRERFYNDLKIRLFDSYPLYEVTSGQCDDLKNPICSDKATKNSSTKVCYDSKPLKKMAKDAGHDDISIVYNELKQNCHQLLTCFRCLLADLQQTEEYDETRIHAAAVNFTVIEFRVWQYFSIYPRVDELQMQAISLELDARKKCESTRDCVSKMKRLE